MKVIFTDEVPYKKKHTKKTKKKLPKKRGAPRSDFFHFHSVFGKPFANNRVLAQIQGLAPLSGKSWIHHWKWHITYSPWRIKGWGRGGGGGGALDSLSQVFHFHAVFWTNYWIIGWRLLSGWCPHLRNPGSTTVHNSLFLQCFYKHRLFSYFLPDLVESLFTTKNPDTITKQDFKGTCIEDVPCIKSLQEPEFQDAPNSGTHCFGFYPCFQADCEQ